MDFARSPGPNRIIYGEGAVHPAFLGSLYMRDDEESQHMADYRFSEAMKSLGFVWLGDPNERR